MMELSMFDQVLKVSDKLSPPLMLAFICWGAWRIVRWLAPRGDSVVKAHLDFLKTMKDLLASTTAELNAQGATLRDMATEQRESREEAMRVANQILDELRTPMGSGKRT